MAPFEIRDSLLSDLRKLRSSFFKAETAAALDRMSDAEKAKAGETLVNTNIAIRKLETIQLQEIANELKTFEQELVDASGRLEKGVKNLGEFKKTIDAAADVLALLGRIAALVGVPI